MAKCPNGHPTREGTPLCPTCGAGPLVPPQTLTRSRMRAIVAVAVLMGAAAVMVPQIYRNVSAKNVYTERWSGYPHNMGCEVRKLPHYGVLDAVHPDGSAVGMALPEELMVKDLTLTHPEPDTLQIDAHFVRPFEAPQIIRSPFTEDPVEAPGSVTYTFWVDRDQRQVKSYEPDGLFTNGFTLSSPDRNSNRWILDNGPIQGGPILKSVQVDGATVTFSLSFPSDKYFLEGPFRPLIKVTSGGWLNRPAVASSTGIPGFRAVTFDGQECSWGTPPATPMFEPKSGRPAAPPQQSTMTPASPASAPRPLAGADSQGFLGYPDARCLDADNVVALARTDVSMIAICRNPSGNLYYRGFGLQNQLALFIDDVTRTQDGYEATRDGYRYNISRASLEILNGATEVSNEQVREYWEE